MTKTHPEPVDVIIPVYRPTEKLLTTLLMLERSKVPAGRVIVINTGREHWEKFFSSYDVCARYPFLEVHHIEKEDFDHGGTRNFGVSLSKSPFFLLMTDDAVPADPDLIGNLLEAFEDPEVGMAYARQIANKRAGVIEKYTRHFNYPPVSLKKGAGDLERLGIKAFFASNVCCMYRRSFFDELGGFPAHVSFNEDMIYARKLINDKKLIAYRAEAKVFHSHSYTGAQQFRRNFQNGVSHADHPETFSDVKASGEGMRLVKKTAERLCKKGLIFMLIPLIWQSACKYAGYTLGERYDKLPLWIRGRLLHPEKGDEG
ncbi:MAG: glycosyltransferase family 2 protein [Lachnospiraceae bacterium]|nr:glycosyltransferase family 2 protein [Lachnospiraceae bacterium]